MYTRHHYAYYRNDDHAKRDAFLGMIRSLISPLRGIWFLLATLKLCSVISLSWGWIIMVFAAHIILDYVLDLVNIAIDKSDKKKEEEAMRRVSTYREEADPGCESGDRGETDPYPGYGEAD